MDIKKIALTGGPCGGKTTSIQKIVEEFSEKGYQVIVVPEAATLLINMGIKPFGENALSSFEFQKLILEMSDKLEKVAYNTALQSTSNTIIVCDRGALDSKAYIDKEGYKALLKFFNVKEADLMKKYDLVIHLRTAALGKEEFYTLENNGAITETIEQAREKDLLTLNAWLGHPKLRIIGNDTDFDGKINNVISEIYAILDKPYPIQRQYKYLVNEVDSLILSGTSYIKQDIEQYVISYEGKEVILRKTIKDDEVSYTAITKVDTNINNERITTKKMISDKDYYDLIPANEKPIKKERYCFEYQDQYFRLDAFEDGLSILELEETNKTKQVKIPDYIVVGKNITTDKDYRNSSIYNRINNKVKHLYYVFLNVWIFKIYISLIFINYI